MSSIIDHLFFIAGLLLVVWASFLLIKSMLVEDKKTDDRLMGWYYCNTCQDCGHPFPAKEGISFPCTKCGGRIGCFGMERHLFDKEPMPQPFHWDGVRWTPRLELPEKETMNQNGKEIRWVPLPANKEAIREGKG